MAHASFSVVRFPSRNALNLYSAKIGEAERIPIPRIIRQITATEKVAHQ